MAIHEALQAEKIRSLKLLKPLTAARTAAVKDVLQAMRATPGGEAVVVVDEGRPVGIFTERDVLMKIVGLQQCEQTIERFMTPNPVTLKAEDSIGEAIRVMGSKRYRHVALVDDQGKLAGIVRVKDLLDWIAERYPEDILNIPPRPHQRILQAEGG